MTNLQQLQEEFKNEVYLSEHALGGIELRNKVFKALEKAHKLGQQDMLETAMDRVEEYFKGIIVITSPELTKISVLKALNNLEK